MFKSKLLKVAFVFIFLSSSLLLQSSTPPTPIGQTCLRSNPSQVIDYFNFFYFKEFRMNNGCWASLFYVITIEVDYDNQTMGIHGEILSMSVDCGPQEYFARIEVGNKGRTATSMRFVGKNPMIDDELNQFEEESLKLLNADIQTIR